VQPQLLGSQRRWESEMGVSEVLRTVYVTEVVES